MFMYCQNLTFAFVDQSFWYLVSSENIKDVRHVGFDFYDLLMEALIDNGVRFVSWVLSSCQFKW